MPLSVAVGGTVRAAGGLATCAARTKRDHAAASSRRTVRPIRASLAIGHAIPCRQRLLLQRRPTQLYAKPSNNGSSEPNGSAPEGPEKGGAAPIAKVQQAAASIKESAQELLAKMDGMWFKFLPMIALFFCMAFINTTVDSLKDTIVVTAAGSGPQVIPFLTVYGTLPSAIIFLIIFSAASQRFGREQLFNGVVTVFIAFFAAFAWLLYPSHQTIHLYQLGETLHEILPVGLSGLVIMLQNWTFTAFYIAAELWGDVGLSLLFWGLANETTTHDEAPIIYPLFGVGANFAQVIAGRFLNKLGEMAAFFGGAGEADFTGQLRFILTVTAIMGVAVLGIHRYICKTTAESFPAKKPEVIHTSPVRKEAIKKAIKDKKPSLGQAMAFLLKSPQIRCLAIMALAQGITTNLMDMTWKTHLRMLYPSPEEYAACMGNVASSTGVITGFLMLASPILFKRLGWKGVAGVTPTMLLWGGVPFFTMAIVYNLTTGQVFAPALLTFVVFIGAMLYVICRGAKFSLFKPAEEMVYIGLDEESRTKGKAAIDVVGAQTGKALSSGLQQLLLLLGGGQIALMLPIMAAAFVTFLAQWQKAVSELATHFMQPDTPDERDWHGMTLDEGMLDETEILAIDAEIDRLMRKSHEEAVQQGGDDPPSGSKPVISPT